MRVWIPVSEQVPEVCVPVIGFCAEWVDEDYAVNGMRECYLTDEGDWISAVWNNSQDAYETDTDCGPSHWQPYPARP